MSLTWICRVVDRYDAFDLGPDNKSISLTSVIVTNETALNTSIPGTYVLTYNVQDSAGNMAVTQYRTVMVVDKVAFPF